MSPNRPASPPPPPDTLAGLRQLTDAIEQKDSPVQLGSRSRRVLIGMLESPQQVAVSSIVELAQQLGVNPSTLTRLAQRLGYPKYSLLQALFRNELTEGRHFYSEQANRLVQGSGEPSLSILERLGRQESSNIAALVDGIDPAQFEATAQWLGEAKRVRIHAMRQFHAVSHFFSYALGMLRQDVAPLDAGRQGVADALAQLEAGDLLVVVSCFPYTQSVLRTAEVAAKRGLKVVALTDSAASPLLASADYHFLVPNQSAFYSNSMCAFMLLCEGLLSRTATLLGERGVDALQQREALIGQLSEWL